MPDNDACVKTSGMRICQHDKAGSRRNGSISLDSCDLMMVKLDEVCIDTLRGGFRAECRGCCRITSSFARCRFGFAHGEKFVHNLF